MDELIRWPVFQQFGRSVTASVKVAIVFNKGLSSLYVDFDDDVYFCWAILVRNGHVWSREKREDLCGKEIFKFETGRPCLALSEDGGVYSCLVDCEELDQIEMDLVTDLPSFDIMSSKFMRHTIVDVACGIAHTVALSDTGYVFTWGKNNGGQCGTGHRSASEPPNMVRGLYGIYSISASGNISACLSAGGVIYVWGYANRMTPQASFTPSKSSTKNGHFKQLVLGKSYGLVLTRDGKIMNFGLEQYLELRDGLPFIPTPVETGSTRFMDIATHKWSSTSAALSTDGIVYVWSHNEVTPESPVSTTCTSLDSVFPYYRGGKVRSYRNIHNQISSAWSMIKSFDNPTSSDSTFIVNGRPIHVHKTILMLKSEYFRTMFDGAWKESGNENEVLIMSHTFPVYHAMLKFFYTEEVDVEDLLLPELLSLAHETLNTSLVDQCVRLLTRNLTCENVCLIHDLASTLELESLVQVCDRFSRARLYDVLQSESFAELPSDRAHKFTCSVVDNWHHHVPDDQPATVSNESHGSVKRKGDHSEREETPSKRTSSRVSVPPHKLQL